MVPHGIRAWSAYKGPQICSFLLILVPRFLCDITDTDCCAQNGSAYSQCLFLTKRARIPVKDYCVSGILPAF